MIFPMIGDWLIGALMIVFISVLDTVCYALLIVSYNIFYAVSQIDLFGGGTAGATLYETISQRIYMVLSIIMVFIFAYQLIMLIIDPDGKGKGAMSQVVKDTLISIVLLIVLPLVYRYMAMFQFHVLENNTIGAIITGTNGASSGDPGKNVAIMVYLAFYHPKGTDYNTFFYENGKIKSSAEEDCLAQTAAADGEEHTKTCNLYVEAISEWSGDGGWIASLTWKRQKLRNWVFDTMDYYPLLSSIAGLAVAYVFFIYAIDIGTRAVKLGVLQLISPIPVILRIFPQTKKSFDTWFDHMKKTYLELFVRVAVIFFALEVIKMVPTFIAVIFQSQDSSTAGLLTKSFATVILILGILKFGQDAPTLFKELFSVGGNLLQGMNLKVPFSPNPATALKKGVTSRLEDNKAFMWGASKASAGYGGFRSRFGSQYEKNKYAATDATGNEHKLRSAYSALGSGVRGLVTGLGTSNKLEHFDAKNLRQGTVAGADAANKQFNESSKLQAYATNKQNYLNDLYDTGSENARSIHEVRSDYHDANRMARRIERDERKEERDYEREQYRNRLSGDYSATQATAQSLAGILDGLTGVKANTKDKTKSITKKIDDLQQTLNTMSQTTDPGAFTEREPVQGTMSMGEYNRAMEDYWKRKKIYDEKVSKYSEYKALKDNLDAAKAERNDIIAKELSYDASSKFATNALDDVLDKLKKAPSGAVPDATNILASVQDLRFKAELGHLSGADIKELNSVIDKLTNAKVYAAALSEQEKNKTKNFNASSGGSSGGSGGNGSNSSGGGSASSGSK